MVLLTGLKDQIERLVHPAALPSPLDAARHRFFIVTRLITSCAALALAPLYLAAGGVPGWPEALILAWMVFPLVAVAHVAKTGDLSTGEIASCVAWIGLASTAYFAHVCSLGAAAALVFLVPLETAFHGSPRRALACLSLAGVTLVCLVSTVIAHRIQSPTTTADGLLVVFAGLHAASLAVFGILFERTRRQLTAVDAYRHQILTEALGDPVLRIDRSGAVVAATGPVERRFGLKPQMLLGRGLFERVHVADRPAFLTTIGRSAVEPSNVRLRIRLASVQRVDEAYEEPVFGWMEMQAKELGESPGRDGAGSAIAVAAFRDISAQIDHETAIADVKREAERASAWKDRFLATVSHELRTPLNSIIGFGEMLTNETLTPADPAKRREYAEIIRASGQHLLAVVNSLLDLSKLDAGQFELLCEGFDVAGLIHTCCDMVSLKAEEGHVTVRREVAFGLEPLLADKRACKQILLNLLSNAVKFTPAGGSVTISAKPDGKAVLIAVSDTGIGIKPRDMPRLGDPFFQVRDTYDRPYEGTGLGLSVVKGLVGLHGGTITAESAPGEGTSITVRLPFDCRRSSAANEQQKARIEVVPRFTRPASSGLPSEKVQKIA